jgi:hypothetical protein
MLNGMTLLLIRVLVAPLLVAGGSLAQRRWGLTVGGRLIGLPLTSLPLLGLMTFSDGNHFAAGAATASLAGDVAASAWCLAYAVAARRYRPWWALLAATGAFAAVAFPLDHMAISTVEAALMSASCLLGALAWWPTARGTARPVVRSRAELPIRMALAAAFTFALSSAASDLGSRSAGLLGSFPVLTVVLAVAVHRGSGSAATNQFLRGVIAGSWSLVVSLTVIGLTLPAAGPAVAFPSAVVAALGTQWLTSHDWRPARNRAKAEQATRGQPVMACTE